MKKCLKICVSASSQISMTLEKIVWTDSLNYILVLTRYYKKDILLYCDPTKKKELVNQIFWYNASSYKYQKESGEKSTQYYSFQNSIDCMS